ncbi:MAG: hypothetical protein HXX19_15565, partial [Rhodoferax sp.]|nr:hypothetical protein [Rhodoferax sp.]
MMGRSIRTRMALASVAPVLLVVLAMVSIFWQDRVQDLEASHQQRVELLAHQAALFSAYGLFSGNTASLQSVVQQIQQAPGVQTVRVYDGNGNPVASSGARTAQRLSELADTAYVQQQRRRNIDVWVEKIRPAVLPIEDLYSTGEISLSASNTELGSAVIEVSRQDLNARKREALLTATWVGAVGMLLGGLLAFRLGNWVVGPLVRVSQMVN